MGMFNYVEYQCPCPKCGEIVEGFQTKDGDDLVLATLKPADVDHFYTFCDNPDCGTWIDFHRIEVPAFPFRMTAL